MMLTLVSFYNSSSNISGPVNPFQHHYIVWSLLCTSQPSTNQFVFIRQDAYHTPLQQPHEGPFKSYPAQPKFLKVEKGGNQETISVDRLKLANVDPSTIMLATPKQPKTAPQIQPSPPKTTLVSPTPPDTTLDSPTPPVQQTQYTLSGKQAKRSHF